MGETKPQADWGWLSVRLSSDQLRALNRMAVRCERSRSGLVRLLLKRALQQEAEAEQQGRREEE